MMVFISWFLSMVLSCPQAIMFRKIKRPKVEFYQCTLHMYLEMKSEMTFIDGQIKFSLIGLDPKHIYTTYNFLFLLFVYFLPLSFITVNLTRVIQMLKSRHSAPMGAFSDTRNVEQSRLFFKSHWKNLRMSLCQVISFSILWAPYIIQQVW